MNEEEKQRAFDYATRLRLNPKATDDHWATWMREDVTSDERDQLHKTDLNYHGAQVKQAIIHTRQDLVMVISYLSSQNKRQQKILNRLSLLVALGAIAVTLALLQIYRPI